MSFLSDVQAALGGKKIRGLDTAFYKDWAGFWKACPLSRSMLVTHTDLGTERVLPERDVDHYQDLFFSGDSFGLVLSKAGRPVTGVVYRRLAPDGVEQTLRIGQPTGYSGLRSIYWDLGIRRVYYKIRKSMTEVHSYMDEMDKHCGDVTRTVVHDDGTYLHYEVVLNQKPSPA